VSASVMSTPPRWGAPDTAYCVSVLAEVRLSEEGISQSIRIHDDLWSQHVYCVVLRIHHEFRESGVKSTEPDQ
jgi:hypothetical protein